ncbi:helix-turn-helix domain-containing protein [Sinisalibacter lacisalsi]|uniref:Transcriptional regulator n=1 Tax=Sinisalibacter lacisalsi TaxID=1526570 RepID=A0ABQ1QJV9_9RHOB|nr:transcriptional regulator [Sinisalibacter lacisalsi]GGD30182.1 transcriptional regulator [Sinisalibacter lacisalsi]
MQDDVLTAGQIRAARAVLGLTISQLAIDTGIGLATLKRYEAVEGVPKSRKGHLETLRKFLESAGIEFIGTPDDGPGIRIHRTRPDRAE